MKELTIVDIPENRNYWSVRTQGGKWYDEFRSGSYIAINWNEISLERILGADSVDNLNEIIKHAFPKQQRHGLTATHMIRFANEMCHGDIVVIPGKHGTEFSFGQIEGDAFTYTKEIENDKCHYTKRRKVNWLKHVQTATLEPKLQSIKYAQPTVNTLNLYAELIDRELGGFLYTKGDLGYVVVRVGEENEIRAKDLADFLTATLDAIHKMDPDVNIDDIRIQLNIQSPGPITWITKVGIIFTVATVLYITTPGEYKLDIQCADFKISSAMKTEGLSEVYLKYDAQKHSQEMEKLRLQQQKLDIKLLEPAIPSKFAINEEQK